MSEFRRRLIGNSDLIVMGDIRLIADITVENDVTGVVQSVTKDLQGKPLGLKEIFVRITAKGPSENEQRKTMYMNGHTEALSDGYAICSKFQNEYENFNTSSTTLVERIFRAYWSSVTSIQIKTSSGKYLGKGSNIMIWGR